MEGFIGFSFYLILILFCVSSFLTAVFDFASRLWIKEDNPKKIFISFFACGYIFGVIFYFLKFLNLNSQTKIIVYVWIALLALIFITIAIKMISSLTLIQTEIVVFTGVIFSALFLALILTALKYINGPYYYKFINDFMIFFV